jgi:hypothetical protein
MDLVLAPGVVLPRRDAAATIDGTLDDTCWKDVKTVPFQNSPFSMLAASVDFRVFRDAENLYFGYHRKAIAHARDDVDQAMLGNNDGLDIYVADSGKRVGIRFVIRRNGKATAQFGTVGVSRKTDPGWKGEWQHAVQEVPDGWMAELALPIKTLSDAGMDLRRLQLNCMSLNVTRSGVEGIFLTDPYYSVKFSSCSRFQRLVPPPIDAPEERSFTVRLHFAEIDDVRAGQRVFNVGVQGRTVLQGLDIIREAGGRNRALVKEFNEVAASEQIVIELTAETPDSTLPVISGLEVIEEE